MTSSAQLKDEKGILCAMANAKTTGRLGEVFSETVIRMPAPAPEHTARCLCLTAPALHRRCDLCRRERGTSAHSAEVKLCSKTPRGPPTATV